MKVCPRRTAYRFKKFFNLGVTKKLVKENTDLNFIVYFTQVRALLSSLKHKSKLQIVENSVKLIQYFLKIIQN